jgi:hypothetical protein
MQQPFSFFYYNALPVIHRKDVETIYITEWKMNRPENMRQAVTAIVTAWERTPWSAFLLSSSCLVSTDGDTVLIYEQWASHEADPTYRRMWVEETERVAGITYATPVAYRLYRSAVSEAIRVPGCIVLVSAAFDRAETAQQWVDTVFEALASEVNPHPGGIAGHFHISTEGKGARVINYAEWVDEEAHKQAIETGSGRGIARSDSQAWQRVRHFPGMKPAGELKRYHLYRSISQTKN